MHVYFPIKGWLVSLLSAVLFLCQIPNVQSAAPTPAPAITLIVQASLQAQYRTTVSLNSKVLLKAILETKEQPVAQVPELIDTWLYIEHLGAIRKFAVTPYGQLVDIEHHASFTLPYPLVTQFMMEVIKARAQHYGQLTDWKDINMELPKYTIFTIMDMESGLRFRGQRRAGSNHADVQPVTEQDTAIMKQIFGGVWSWDRKAVRIEYNGKAWGASMNGMPHGGDGIPENKFSGHFCIHFPGSTTHGKGNLDIAHQLMAYKASGRINELLQQLTPGQLIEVWIAAVNWHDEALISAISGDKATFAEAATIINRSQKNGILPLDAAHSVQFRRLSNLPPTQENLNEAVTLAIPVELSILVKNQGNLKKRLQFFFVRRSIPGGWMIAELVG
jgi:hypothetical protein